MRRPVRLAALGAAALIATSGALAATLAGGTAQAATAGGGIKIAYFTQWGIYQNAFYPKNLDTSGIAGKLDFIEYAFENIDPNNLTCFEATSAASQDENNPNAGDGAGDAFADYQKSYGAAISVDGVGDTWDQPLAGNFNQLKKLKAKYPNLKILLSLGGWTYSKYFSDAAATDASRKKLVSSCIDMFIKGNLPEQAGRGGPGSAAGIFDGFDIDWEYPGSPGGHVGNHYSPADKQNYTKLLAEFRSELDAYGASTGRKMYLTAAVPAGQDKIQYIETDKISQYLDFANVMTYDMHGGWEAQGPTNFQDPIYSRPDDPMTPLQDGQKYSIDSAITAWTDGDPGFGIPGGFPASKLTIGYPLYYRGWTGVSAGDEHGLFQPASAPAPGHPLSGNVAGVSMYKELSGFVDNPAYTYFDPVAQSAYFYNGTIFWAGDSKQSIQAKADYQHCHGLAGAMVYSLEDDPQAVLLNEIINDTNGSTSTCTSPPPPPSTSPTHGTSPTPPTSPTTGPTSPTTGPTSSPTGGSGGSCSAPAWSATAVYTGGQQVSYNGHTWTARWWTQGDIPGNNSQNVWTDNGACTGGGGTPTTGPTGGTGQCTGLDPWSSDTVYLGGDTVTYNGHKYTAKWWTLGQTPSGSQVWTDNGPC